MRCWCSLCNSLTGSSAGAALSEESLEQFANANTLGRARDGDATGTPDATRAYESSPSRERDDLSLYLTLREALHALSDVAVCPGGETLFWEIGTRLHATRLVPITFPSATRRAATS